MLELDLILIPFYRHQYPALSSALQQQYREFLECTDRELYQWLIKHEVPESKINPQRLDVIITLVRNYALDPSRPRTL